MSTPPSEKLSWHTDESDSGGQRQATNTISPASTGEKPASGTVVGLRRKAPSGSSNPLARAMRRFMRNRTAMVGLVWLGLIALIALFAPLIAPHNPAAQSGTPFSTPSSEYWLGTDDLGRDVFSRLVFACRVTIRASFEIVGIAAIIGVALGLVSGYAGKSFDYFAMRVMDAISSFPPLVFAIAVAAVLGPGLGNTIIAVAAIFVPGLTRLVRGQTLAVKEESFIEASRAIGTRAPVILLKRVLPSLASPLIVQLSILLGAALLVEASLSFLGFGVQPPDPSWGQMLRSAYDFIFAYPWQMIAPGVAILLAVLAWNIVGDGLRDSMGHQSALAPRAVRKGARMGVTSVKRQGSLPAGQPGMMLSIRDLEVRFATEAGEVTVIDEVSFDVAPGEIVGLVGESGSGKSMTSLAAMRLIPTPPGWIAGGAVYLDGEDLLAMDAKALRKRRGRDISMIYQDPMSSLNPAFTIGNQMSEALRQHHRISAAKARETVLEMLELVGISDPQVRLSQYPHQLSGGMRQRVMIAQALICKPRMLIADEPTTALDVTIQAEILDLLRSLQRDMDMAMIFVTHDLGVVADICDRVVVMYAGQIVEQASVGDLFARPQHPYTKSLLKAMPQLAGANERLAAIPGVVPMPSDLPIGCRFGPRCSFHEAVCDEPLSLLEVGARHDARCIRHDELNEVKADE